jgi:hypothetical protein
MNDLEVEERIRATLHAVADAGDERGRAIAELDVVDGGRRRRGTNLMRAAAAIVGVCLIAAATLLATGGGHGAVDIRGALGVPRAQWQTTTAPLLAPTWLPPGMHLLQMTSEPGIQVPGRKNITIQLFRSGPPKTAHAQEFAISTAYFPGESVANTSIRVRGYAAAIEPDIGSVYEIFWIEPGHFSMRARISGIAQSRAIEILDALHPRSNRPLDGFDPTSVPAPFRLDGESVASLTSSMTGDLRYAPALNRIDLGLTDFRVVTTPPGDTGNYLFNSVAYNRTSDGSIEFVGSVPNEHGNERQLNVVWPDGRSIVVFSSLADINDATLRRVARSVRLLDTRDAEQLRATIDARLAALPLWTAATIGGAEVELRGGTQPLAVCLHLGTQPRVCEELQGATGPGIGGVVVAGQWIVFAAQHDKPHLSLDGSSIHAHVVAARGWHLVLALPGPEAKTVEISGDSSTNRPGA